MIYVLYTLSLLLILLGLKPFYSNRKLKKKIKAMGEPVNQNVPYCPDCGEFVNPHKMPVVGTYTDGSGNAYGCPGCKEPMLDEFHWGYNKNQWIKVFPDEFYAENKQSPILGLIIIGLLIHGAALLFTIY